MLHGREIYAKRNQDATESNPYHLNKFYSGGDTSFTCFLGLKSSYLSIVELH